MAFAGRSEQAQSRGGATARGDISKIGTWHSDGAQFIRPPKWSKGAVQVEGRDLMKQIHQLLGEVAPRVAEELSRALVPAATVAYENWPVGKVEKAQHSKELVGIEYKILGPTVWMASLVNRANYAVFIRRGSTARTFIFKRGARVADLAARRLSDSLGKG